MSLIRVIPFIILVQIFVKITNAQVGVGTNSPNVSAQLDVSSTSKGFLPPRMNESQRIAISNPAAGLVIWCYDCGANGELQVFNGSAWTNLVGGAASSFVCGTSKVTFSYRNTLVTYGTVSSLGKCWLDRNLGASRVASASNDVASYGDLFQWGRGDDGHQARNSNVVTTSSSNDNPGNANFISSPFSEPFDWRSPQNPNLWQGVNGTNNVCPSGWRIPTEAELNAERVSWISNNPQGALASPLKLPLAGFRDFGYGQLNDEGGTAFYWTSSISGNYTRSLYFSSGNASFSTNNRANGFSVRCIKN